MSLLKKTTIAKLVAFSILATSPISTFAIEPIQKEDMFTFDNIHNAYESDGKKEYMISVEGTVYGRGNGVFGVNPTGPVDTSEWLPVITNTSSMPISNIIAINLSGDVLFMITTTGECFQVSMIDKVATKPSWQSGDNAILNVSHTSASGEVRGEIVYVYNHTYLKSNNTVGNYTRAKSGSGVWKTAEPITSVLNNEIIKANSWAAVSSTYNSTPMLAGRTGNIYLTKIGELYNTYQTPSNLYNDPGRKTTTRIAQNIADYVHWGWRDGIVLNSLGQLSHINTDTGVLTPITLIKDSTPVKPQVLAIISDDECGNNLVIETTEGFFTGSYSDLQYNEEMTQIKPVTASPLGVIGADGNLYKRPTPNAMDGLIKQEKQMWENDNPIVRESVLAKFNIDANMIFRRYETFPLEFSLITAQTPTAFNLYYSYIDEVSDKNNWRSIASNVAVSELDVKEYDPEITNSYGEKILGKTYTYTWTIGSKDLTNIQVIVEPIY